MKTCLLAIALLVMPVHAVAAEGKFERTLKVTGAVDLDVRTGAGSTNVRSGETGSVRINGVIRSRDGDDRVCQLESNPPIEQDGNSIRIGHITDRELERNISISYEVVVPVETRLRSQTGSGSQTIEGIRGPVDASTGSGGLTINNIGDDVKVSTGSGSIRVDGVKGRVRASTGSGGIRGTALAGPVVASTGSGGVRLEQTAPGGAEVKTGSGAIELSGVKGPLRAHSGSGSIRAEGEPSAEWNLEVASGGVHLKLPSQAAFDFRARTASGHISIDHPLSVQGLIGKKEVQGKVRGGGPLVSVRTASGNIEVQ
ncbi:MAG: DUF4097 family beta strand repeat protein [Acidobacteria bacterium]|nr:DUF4097 family beta strand repeat protein [Acidobacteriota bacterium]